MISTVRLARNDDLEASDSIVQIGHLLGRNGVLIISTIRVAKDDDFVKCNSILRVGHVLGRSSVE